MIKKQSVAIVVFFALLSASLMSPATGIDYTTAPIGLTSLQARLAESIVGIDCQGKIGVGFAGNFSISSELKNSGTYSILVSNKNYLEKCYYHGQQEVKLYKSTSTYTGETWGSSAQNSEDFASLHTVLDLPTQTLYGNTFPEVGWWVTIVAYVPNFGLKWINSKIYTSNEKDFTFLLETADPILVNGGIVFDNSGTFIGLATNVNNNVAGYTRMVGAPLQCEPTNQTGQGITLCNSGNKRVDRTAIWTTRNDGTGVTPGVAPTSTAKPASTELTDAISAAEKALNAYRATVADCNRFTSDLEESMHNFGIAQSFLEKCNANDVKASDLLGKLSGINKNSATTSTLISQLNSYIDQANTYTEEADATNAELQDAESELIALADQILALTDLLVANQESWDSLSNRLAGIPKSITTMIYKNSNYKKLSLLIADTEKVQAQIDKKVASLANISNLVQLKSAVTSTRTFTQQFSGYQQFDLILSLTEKLIPPYVCVKGSVISVLPKTGKCAKGSAKTSTS